MNKAQRDRIPIAAAYIISSQAQVWKSNWSKQEQLLWEIWMLLQDNEWWTSEQIANKVGKSQKYVSDVMRLCVTPWGLVSSKVRGRSGYKLND